MKLKNRLIALVLFTIWPSISFAAYNPTNPNGQSTSANSSPVVVASDNVLNTGEFN